jgi:hypothetical protein
MQVQTKKAVKDVVDAERGKVTFQTPLAFVLLQPTRV